MKNKALNFEAGRPAERMLKEMLVSKGFCVIPIYDFTIGDDAWKKGPRIYTKNKELVSPDMLAMKGADAVFIEAKQKSVFTLYRKNQEWQTGIDTRHFLDYYRLAQLVDFPIWVFFVHLFEYPPEGDIYNQGPSPTGIFGQEVNLLFDYKDHEYNGMTYWNKCSLIEIDDVAL